MKCQEREHSWPGGRWADLPKGGPRKGGEPAQERANQPQTGQCISNTRGREYRSDAAIRGYNFF